MAYYGNPSPSLSQPRYDPNVRQSKAANARKARTDLQAMAEEMTAEIWDETHSGFEELAHHVMENPDFDVRKSYKVMNRAVQSREVGDIMSRYLDDQGGEYSIQRYQVTENPNGPRPRRREYVQQSDDLSFDYPPEFMFKPRHKPRYQYATEMEFDACDNEVDMSDSELARKLRTLSVKDKDRSSRRRHPKSDTRDVFEPTSMSRTGFKVRKPTRH